MTKSGNVRWAYTPWRIHFVFYTFYICDCFNEEPVRREQVLEMCLSTFCTIYSIVHLPFLAAGLQYDLKYIVNTEMSYFLYLSRKR